MLFSFESCSKLSPAMAVVAVVLAPALTTIYPTQIPKCVVFDNKGI